jgi:hypothetical protein
MDQNGQRDGAKKGSTSILVTAAVLGLVIGTLVAVPRGFKAFSAWRTKAVVTKNWGLDPKNTDRIYALAQLEMTPMVEGPAFRAFADRELEAKKKKTDVHVDAVEFGRVLGRALVARGIPRLPDDSLAKLHQLKTKMASSSKRACPCYWDVRLCSEADIFDGLAKLSDDELATWFHLSAQAGRLELDATDAVPDTSKDFREGLVVIVKGLSEEDKMRFVDILKAKNDVPKRDQCFAMQTIFQGSEGLEPVMKARFVRALSNLGAKETND